jgi:hypothetical protein
MALSFFTDKEHRPTEEDLASCLGSAATLWSEIRKAVAARVQKLVVKWGYTTASTGWGLRLCDGKRVIVYLTPRKDSFLASLALGEKALRAGASRLPGAARRLAEAAPRYAEGRGIRILVKKAADLRTVAALVALKLGG